MLVAAVPEEQLAPQVVSIGTSRALRIRRVGVVYFVEQSIAALKDGTPPNDATDWKVVAVSKPDLARPGKSPSQEAHEFLMQANADVLKLISEGRVHAKHMERA